MRFTLLAFLCIVLCGCGPSKAERDRIQAEAAQRDRQAVQATMDAMLSAHERSMSKNGKKASGFIERTQYIEGLHQISTDGCPQNFRLAFLDYVQTWERASKPGAGLGSTGEFAIGAVSKSGNAMQDASKKLAAIDTDEARRRLDMVALEYGVEIHR